MPERTPAGPPGASAISAYEHIETPSRRGMNPSSRVTMYRATGTYRTTYQDGSENMSEGNCEPDFAGSKPPMRLLMTLR